MSRRVVTSGGGGMSLSDRFSALSHSRSQGSVATHIPRNNDRNNDRSVRGGARSKPSDRGVQKASGQHQRRDDRQGQGRDGGRGRGRGRGNAQRGGRDAGKPRDGKGEKKKPVTTDDLDKDLDKYFSRDPTKAKANLDSELEDYMKKRQSDAGTGEAAQ